MDDLYKTLNEHLPADIAKEVNRILYGNPCRHLQIPDQLLELSNKENFDIICV